MREDIGRGFAELQATGTRIASVLDECYDWGLSCAPKQFLVAVREVRRTIDRWVLGDALDQFKRETFEDEQSDSVSMEPFSLFRRHPLICGLLEFVIVFEFAIYRYPCS